MTIRSLFLLVNYDQGDVVAVLFTKNPVEETKIIFINSDDKLVVLEVTFNSGKSFRLVDVYTLFGSRQSDFFWHPEKFLGTSQSIMLLGDYFY